MYTISDIARHTGVSTHTLRYYERIGLLSPVARVAGGHRRYDDDDVARIRFLTLLRRTGMPIRDMQRFMNLTRAGDHTLADRIELLEAHLAGIDERLETLGQCRRLVQEKIGLYQALAPR